MLKLNNKDQANVAEQGAASKLYLALEKLVPHVLHYASMPHAHADAHRDAADARRLLAEFAMKMTQKESLLILPTIDSRVTVMVDGKFLLGVVTGHDSKDGKPIFYYKHDHVMPDGSVVKGDKWAWLEQLLNMTF